jgi:hypothetical protein
VAKLHVSNGVLTTIFWRKMQSYPECPAAIPIAIIPVGRWGWKALTSPKVVRSYPLCASRVEEAQEELRQIYVLAK